MCSQENILMKKMKIHLEIFIIIFRFRFSNFVNLFSFSNFAKFCALVIFEILYLLLYIFFYLIIWNSY